MNKLNQNNPIPSPLSLDDEFERYMCSLFPTVKEYETQYKESRKIWMAASLITLKGLKLKQTTFEDLEKQLREFLTLFCKEHELPEK